MYLPRFGVIATIALALAFGHSAAAVQTKVIRHQSFSDFSKGELRSTSLSSQGELSRAPAKRRRVELNANLLFATDVDEDGAVYAATGDAGYVYRIEKNDDVTTIAKLREPLVTAIMVGGEGEIFAAVAPGGKIYRLDADGPNTTPTVFCKTGEMYVWSMLPRRNGAMFLATGKEGKVLRVDKDGESEVWFDSDSANVIKLMKTRDGRVLALTQGKCRVYELKDKEKATVVYEGKLDEGRAFVEDKNGVLYLALNSGATASRVLTKPPTSAGSAIPTLPSVVSRMKSAGQAVVIRLDPEGFASAHWMAVEAPIHSMLLDRDRESLLVAAGSKGKLYRIAKNGDHSVLFNVEESIIMSMAWTEKGLLLATADGASLYVALTKDDDAGVYLSETIDASFPVKWGHIRWEGRGARRAPIKIAVRTGATAEADDDLWESWSKDIDARDGHILLEDTVARYLQYRITFDDSASKDELIEKVHLYYRSPNRAPLVKTIVVGPAPVKKMPMSSSMRPSVPVPPGSNSTSSRLSSGTASPGLTKSGDVTVDPFSNKNQKLISWQMTDPNRDKLQTDVFFKAEDEEQWKLVQEKVTKNSLQFDTKTIPDGLYRVRVVINDSLSNPYNDVATVSLVGAPFAIDNTPPNIKAPRQSKLNDNAYKITFSVHDDTSLIYDGRFAIDVEDWQVISPDDDIFDSNEEKFTIKTDTLAKGEHTMAVLITDSEGNSILHRFVLK